MTGQRILLTGANGLLGQKLLQLLGQEKQISILATSRGKCRASIPQNTSYQSLDMTEPSAVYKIIKEYQPHYIIHTAAKTQVDDCQLDPEDSYRQNVLAVEYVAKAAREVEAFLLHLSTDFIFDGKSGPYDEQAIPNPLSVYGKHKWQAEQIIQQTESLQWAIIRTVLVYGYTNHMSRSNIVLWARRALEQQKPIKVIDDQWRTPTLAEDLAEACWSVVKKRAHGIWHISGAEMMTPYDMVMQIGRYYGYSTNCVQRADASSFSQAAPRPARTGFIIEKAKQLLGYCPRTFEQALQLIDSQLSIQQEA